MESTPPQHVRRASRPTAGELYRRERAAGRAWDYSGTRSANVTPHVDDPTVRLHAVRVVNDDPPGPIRLRRIRTRLDARRRLIVVGRTVSTMATAVLMIVTALAWNTTTQLSHAVTSSAALAHAPRSAGSAENILLMGLDSRKDQSGNDLPADILTQLHAGDSSDGGYNTNTLILIHIPADRRNIVAFSIPRDDLVTMHGLSVPKAKIKEAYGRTKAKVEQQLIDAGHSDQTTLETQGREAGRAAAIRVVRDLTGVRIDRFAEVSLVGFYDIADALGGVWVCLNHPVHDSYSGASFPAGRQQLSGSQALAFVRQRHGLANGDLDRTRRQQAFLVSAMHQLQSAGALTDPTKLRALTGVLHRDIVVSDGWNLLDWAQQMTAPGQHIRFRTLPVQHYATVDGQSVNIIDPASIRAEVQRSFGVPVTDPTSGRTSQTRRSSPTAGPTTSSATVIPNVDGGTAVSTNAAVPCVD